MGGIGVCHTRLGSPKIIVNGNPKNVMGEEIKILKDNLLGYCYVN